MGYFHIHIVDYDRKIVSRAAVAALDDQIVEFGIADLDPALDVILETDRAVAWVPEAHHHRLAGFGLQSQITATTVVARFLLRRHLLFAQRIEPLFRTLAIVSVTLLDQLVDDLVIAIETFCLEKRAFVIVEPQPRHAVQNRLHRFRRRTLEIGVLDPEHETALHFPGIQPAE